MMMIQMMTMMMRQCSRKTNIASSSESSLTHVYAATCAAMGTNARTMTTTTTTRDSARERAYASAAASGSAQPQQAAAGGTGDGRSAKDFYAAVASAVAAHRGTHADEVLTTSLARRVSHAQDEVRGLAAMSVGMPEATIGGAATRRDAR